MTEGRLRVGRFEPSTKKIGDLNMYLPWCCTYSSISTWMPTMPERSATQRDFGEIDSVKRMADRTGDFESPHICGECCSRGGTFVPATL